MTSSRHITAVVPLYNECETLVELHKQLVTVLEPVTVSFDILFVNDGSTDQSAQVLDELSARDPRVGVVHFRRNFGKAAALAAGFERATGDLVVTLDADLQDDPAEIPRFIAQLDAGFDVVSGWKKVRHDPMGKTIPSRLFNWVVGSVFGLRLHDFNCGFKAYRGEALRELNLYGELHRYIPVLLHAQGYRSTEIEVLHHPRRHGHSKYGVERLVKGMFDLMTVVLTTRYLARPLHLFGFLGLMLGLAGFGMLAYLSVLWALNQGPIGNRPLLFLGVLLVMVGVQIVSIGLLGEFVNRVHLSPKTAYVIREYRAARLQREQ